MDYDIIYFSIPSYDPPRMKKFYEKVFKWKFKKVKNTKEDIWTIETSSSAYKKIPTPNGILMKKRPFQKAIHYVLVDDVKKVGERVEENGGRVILKKMKIDNTAFLSIGADPEGNQFGLWEELKVRKSKKKTK